MNRKEQVSVSIPCFAIRFRAVLYITNAPYIQMIQQLLGSPVVYQFYDMWFLVREASSPPVLHNFLLKHNHNLHLSFKGSFVTRGNNIV